MLPWPAPPCCATPGDAVSPAIAALRAARAVRDAQRDAQRDARRDAQRDAQDDTDDEENWGNWHPDGQHGPAGKSDGAQHDADDESWGPWHPDGQHRPAGKSDGEPASKPDANAVLSAMDLPTRYAKLHALSQSNDAATDGKPDAKPDAKPDGKSDSKSANKSDCKSDSKSDGKSDSKSDSKSGTKPGDYSYPGYEPPSNTPPSLDVECEVYDPLGVYCQLTSTSPMLVSFWARCEAEAIGGYGEPVPEYIRQMCETERRWADKAAAVWRTPIHPAAARYFNEHARCRRQSDTMPDAQSDAKPDAKSSSSKSDGTLTASPLSASPPPILQKASPYSRGKCGKGKADAKTDGKADGKADGKSDGKADGKFSKVKSDGEARAAILQKASPYSRGKCGIGKADAKTDGKADSKSSKGKSVDKTDGRPDAEPDAEIKPDGKSKNKPDGQPDGQLPAAKPRPWIRHPRPPPPPPPRPVMWRQMVPPPPAPVMWRPPTPPPPAVRPSTPTPPARPPPVHLVRPGPPVKARPVAAASVDFDPVWPGVERGASGSESDSHMPQEAEPYTISDEELPPL